MFYLNHCYLLVLAQLYLFNFKHTSGVKIHGKRALQIEILPKIIIIIAETFN